MSIRGSYQRLGVTLFYQEEGHSYRNPHETQVRNALEEALRAWSIQEPILDLACGSGEITIKLLELGFQLITGIDPYTGDAFQRRTGRKAEAFTFEQIAAGALDGRSFATIICSYALHLVEPSRLPALIYQLARLGQELWILTPHKRPELLPQWGFRVVGEFEVERVRVRRYLR